mmetsp:Transcript_1675/g.2389  ORF Transcript_1675/g.2389 Transcript_1675/m.2389 type:complete len:306 (+) Transcript_1675:88-1005(+)
MSDNMKAVNNKAEQAGEGEKKNLPLSRPKKKKLRWRDVNVQTCFVANLDSKVKKENLEDAFTQVGTVLEIRFGKGYGSKSYNGTAYVTLSSVEELTNAIELSEKIVINERKVRIEKAKPRENKGRDPSKSNKNKEQSSNHSKSNKRKTSGVTPGSESDEKKPRSGSNVNVVYGLDSKESKKHEVSSQSRKRTVFIGGLGSSGSEEVVEKIFDDLDIVSIRMTKKGYGFVEFEAEDDVMQAVELDGTTVGGRVIKVNRDDRKNNFATTRGKGRKGFSKRGYQKKPVNSQGNRRTRGPRGKPVRKNR